MMLLVCIFGLLSLAQGENVQKNYVEDSSTQNVLEKLGVLKQAMKQQDAVVREMDRRLLQQEETIKRLRIECPMPQPVDMKKNSPATKSLADPETRVYASFACVLDTVTLSCSDGKNISVTSAYYGQYVQACSFQCCPPSPHDCTESLEETAPGDWEQLTETCNGQTTCQMTNPGRSLQSCQDPYHSHYVVVYFSCLPESEEPSAFTASINVDHYYETSDVVIFDQVISNIGNNYDGATSTYVCPASGLYVFSVTVYNNLEYYMTAHIMLEKNILATARSDYADYNQGSVTAVTNCNQGERVWVKSQGANSVYGHSTYKYNIFSGFVVKYY